MPRVQYGLDTPLAAYRKSKYLHRRELKLIARHQIQWFVLYFDCITDCFVISTAQSSSSDDNFIVCGTVSEQEIVFEELGKPNCVSNSCTIITFIKDVNNI